MKKQKLCYKIAIKVIGTEKKFFIFLNSPENRRSRCRSARPRGQQILTSSALVAHLNLHLDVLARPQRVFQRPNEESGQ